LLNFNPFQMNNKNSILVIVFLSISFLLLVFAFWTRLAHWKTNYFFLSAGMAIFFIFIAIGILLVQNNSKK